jgi:peroxiredoxin
MGKEFPPADLDASQKWYKRLVDEFPDSNNAARARGALQRLTSVGKAINVKGPALGGGTADLSQYKGRVVLIHYWSSDTPSAKADHQELLDLYAKYGGRKFEVLGVNLDDKPETAQAYLKEQKLPWKQIYEKGGLFDNRLATEMGIIQLPQMILIDEKGQVVSSNVLTAELGAELKKLIPSEVAAK